MYTVYMNINVYSCLGLSLEDLHLSYNGIHNVYTKYITAILQLDYFRNFIGYELISLR